MPKRLRTLSGDEVIAIFGHFGFSLSFGKGSHCKLSRIHDHERQILVVPRHTTIARGTLKSMYRKAIPYVGEEALKDFFYTE